MKRLMSKSGSRLVAAAALGAVGLWASGTTAEAAFIVEPNGKASANFNNGTAASESPTAGSGTLSAPGLTEGAASVFGGTPYTYTYTPGTDGDNTVFANGQPLNSAAGLSSTGLAGGVTGTYNIYHVFPQSSNTSGQPTIYEIDVNGDVVATDSQDQNVADLATGTGIGLWRLIGQATVDELTDTITVTITTETPGFVGARTAGVLFEPVPEPTTAAMLGLGGLAALVRRRRSHA